MELWYGYVNYIMLTKKALYIIMKKEQVEYLKISGILVMKYIII